MTESILNRLIIIIIIIIMIIIIIIPKFALATNALHYMSVSNRSVSVSS